jgi:hypothetical protein
VVLYLLRTIVVKELEHLVLVFNLLLVMLHKVSLNIYIYQSTTIMTSISITSAKFTNEMNSLFDEYLKLV